ncbi:hypothetical protein AB4144_41295 [Rhizobiaceae sp. 2RAB30]
MFRKIKWWLHTFGLVRHLIELPSEYASRHYFLTTLSGTLSPRSEWEFLLYRCPAV